MIQKMNDIKFFVMTICLLGLISILLTGCEGRKDTRNRADITNETPSRSAEEAGNNQSSFTISSEKTFYNMAAINTDELPVKELSEVLSSSGVSDLAEPGYFMTDLLGRFYYSVDLSKLVPICVTPEQEIVCKLDYESDPQMFIVLDSVGEPANVRFYLGSAWTLPQEQLTFLLDGEIPEQDEATVCAQLFQAHTQGSGFRRIEILDGDRAAHTVSVSFEQYPGLGYHFQYYQYEDYDGYILYCVSDGSMEQVLLE